MTNEIKSIVSELQKHKILPNIVIKTWDELISALTEHAEELSVFFDCECIENDDDYAMLFSLLSQATTD